MKKTLLQLALAAASVAAVSVAQAQPAPTTTAPPAPAPTTTADPNAPGVPTPPPSAAPTTPPPAATTAAPPAATAPVQGDPNAPPPPPPVAPPPAATPPVADTPPPPPTQFVPPPSPTVSWNANPQGGDTTAPTEKPKPLRWRGTTFEWYQYASTQYFGVGGRCNASVCGNNSGGNYGWVGTEDYSYVHLFRFAPNFYVVDDPKDKLTVGATLWGSVEATNSNTTTYQNEFELRDTVLSTKYTRTLMQSPDAEGETPEWFTKVGLGTGVALPTSKASIAYKYLTWNVGPSVVQQIKLLGSKSDFFPNLNVNLSLTYSHAFNRTNVPTSATVHIARQTPTGDPLMSDQMGKYLAVTDNVIAGGALTLPVYKDLSVAFSYRYWMKWKPNPTDGCVQTLTNCAKPGTIPNGNVTYFADTIFDIGVSYNFFDVVEAAVGYSNWTNAIAENGSRQDILWSPDASFYLDLTANLDAIYSKATNRDKQTTAKGKSGSSWF